MSDKDSGDKQPWIVPVLVAVVGAISAITVAWFNKPQQTTTQSTPPSQATSPSPVVSSPTGSSSIVDLTGRWACDDGGTYYIRQIGNKLFWLGEGVYQGQKWSHVYQGYISGDQIKGEWADVPKNEINNAGEIEIKVESSHQFVAVRKTGGFGGSVWKR